MFEKIKHQRLHYFSKHPSRGMVEMYWSVGLMDLGIAAVTLFEPIFLFTLGYSIKEIMFFYLLVYGLYFLILPVAGKIIGRLGYEHSIFYSQFFLIAYYIALFAISQFSLFFFIAPILFAIQKSLYWPAYHADLTLFSQDKQGGREIGGLETISILAYIVGPLIGGVILALANFGFLFVFASVLFMLSVIPLMKIKEIHSKQTFSYKEVVMKMVNKNHRRNFVAYLGFGEELIVMTIWPIFIYIALTDYLEIGSLVAIATLITSVFVLFLGKASDRYKKENILKIGSVFYFIIWIFRGLATKGWHVMSLDAGSRMGKEMLFIPLSAMTYSDGKKLGPLQHGVFFEQSLAVSKIIAAVLVIILTIIFISPWIPIFILASLFSLLYMRYRSL